MRCPRHPRDDIDGLYVPIKEGGRGLASIEDCVSASMQRFEDYTKKSKERLITAASSSNGNRKTKRKQQKLGNRNVKKNNCIDFLSDKMARLYMGNLWQG